MFEFDLQRFAEEESAEAEVVETTDDTGVAEEAETETQEEAGEKAPISEELGGLPEEAAREVMAEAAKMEQDKNTEEDKQEPESQEPDDSQIVKSQQIPYPRFKQKVDESNALKAELEAYKQRFGSLDKPQQAPQQPPVMRPTMQAPPPQRQMPQLNLTPDVMRQIDELKKQEALRMSGLTAEDVDGMEYMEENDPRRAQYQFALKMAESTVVNRIQQAQMEQMRQAEAVLRAHDASVADYNQFAQQEMSDPDFQNVMKYATEDFFYTKNPAEQQTIAAAYARIEQNTASPAEVMLIKNYFTEAKNAYRGGQKTVEKKTNPMNKVKQAGAFPRSQQVEGSSDHDLGVSVATLEKILAEKTWDEIDPKLQKMLMGE